MTRQEYYRSAGRFPGQASPLLFSFRAVGRVSALPVSAGDRRIISGTTPRFRRVRVSQGIHGKFRVGCGRLSRISARAKRLVPNAYKLPSGR